MRVHIVLNKLSPFNFTVCKGSNHCFNLLLLQLVLCRVATIKSLPIHNANYSASDNFISVDPFRLVNRSNILRKNHRLLYSLMSLDEYEKKVQVGKDQENAQSEKDSHSKTKVGKNQTNNQVLIP